MTIKYKTIKEIISNTAVFVVLFNLVALPYKLIFGHIPWELLFLAALFFLMLFLRRKLHGTGIFILVHILLTAAAFLISNSALPGVFIGICSFNSIIAKTSGEWNMHPRSIAVLLGLFAIVFIATELFGGEANIVGSLLSFSALILLLATVLYNYLSNLEVSLDKCEGLRETYSAKGWTANSVAIKVFLGAALSLSVLTMFFHSYIGMILGFIVRAVMAVFVIVSGMLISDDYGLEECQEYEEAEYVYEYVIEEIAYYEYDYEYYYEREYYHEYRSEPGLLENIRSLLIPAGIVAFILLCVIALYILNKERKKRRRKKTDISKESLMPDKLSGKLKLILKGMKNMAASLVAPKAKVVHSVREIYKEKVSEHIGQGIDILHSDRTDIIADKIRLKENIDELTRKYEVARYGK